MKKKLFFPLAIFFTFISILHSQISSPVYPEIEGWNAPAETETYYPHNLWDLINGAADAFLYYGFKELLLGSYTNNNHASIRVEIYRHKDVNHAYGIYSLERAPETHPISIGAEGYIYGSILNFTVDDYYIKISSHTEGEEIEDAIMEIAKSLSDSINPDPELPGVLACFPEEKQKIKSKLFTAEAFMGLGFLHSAFTAEYYYKDDDFFIVFIIAPGSRTDVLNMISKYKSFCKFVPGLNADTIYEFTDPYNGTIYITYSEEYIIGTSNLKNRAKAGKYINEALMKCKELE